jgi:metal-dependent amidase/aminoacylase/carboxypeptidase family protein
MYRAASDMDALPMRERSRPELFASANRGTDARVRARCHVAMLIGAAALLWERRREFAGACGCCFSPAKKGTAARVMYGRRRARRVQSAFASARGSSCAAYGGVRSGPMLAAF